MLLENIAISNLIKDNYNMQQLLAQIMQLTLSEDVQFGFLAVKKL